MERHPGPKRALPLQRQDVLMPGVLPTTAQHHDVAVSRFEKLLASRQRFMGSKNSSATVSVTFETQVCAH